MNGVIAAAYDITQTPNVSVAKWLSDQDKEFISVTTTGVVNISRMDRFHNRPSLQKKCSTHLRAMLDSVVSHSTFSDVDWTTRWGTYSVCPSDRVPYSSLIRNVVDGSRQLGAQTEPVDSHLAVFSTGNVHGITF